MYHIIPSHDTRPCPPASVESAGSVYSTAEVCSHVMLVYVSVGLTPVSLSAFALSASSSASETPSALCITWHHIPFYMFVYFFYLTSVTSSDDTIQQDEVWGCPKCFELRSIYGCHGNQHPNQYWTGRAYRGCIGRKAQDGNKERENEPLWGLIRCKSRAHKNRRGSIKARLSHS